MTIGPAPVVRISGQTGVQTARLVNVSPWGLGLRAISGAPPAVGSRVQIAFGLGRWAIRRVAEVRQSDAGGIGLALADPLPRGLRAQLLDLCTPHLKTDAAGGDAPTDGLHARDPTAGTVPVCRSWVGADGQQVGEVALSRWSETSWLVRRLTASTTHPESARCWRDLYRFAATAPIYSEGQDAHLVVFHDVDDRWSRAPTARVVDWLADANQALSLRIQRFGTAFGPVSPVDLDVVPAVPQRAADMMAARTDPLVCRAMGWDLCALWESARAQNAPGTLRPRGAYEVWTSHGARLEGVVLAEAAGHGASALADLVWIMPSVGCDRAALLQGARRVASRYGIDRGTLVEPDDPVFPLPRTEELTSVDAVALTVWSASGLTQFEAYLSGLDGWPDPP